MSSPVKVLAAIFCVLLISCGSEDTPVPEASSETTAATPQSAGADGESENAGPQLGSFGVDLSHQDPNSRPGDDFFRYANGKWLDSFELPASRSNYGSFTVLSDRSDQRVRTIIDDLSSREPAMGSIEQKISDYYLSYMNVETLNELGISPLLPGLTTLDQIETREQLIAALGRAQPRRGLG